MSLEFADRVKETSTTLGTGALTLVSVTGFQTFSSGIGNTNTCHYAIFLESAGEWEVGRGTISAATLTRDEVFANSLGTTAFIDFSSGTKDVICTLSGRSMARVGAKVSLAANFQLTTNTITIVDFTNTDNVIFDDFGFHDDSTGAANPGRLTIPTGRDGTYLVVCLITFDTNTTGRRLVQLEQFSSSDVAKGDARDQRGTSPAGSTAVGVSDIFQAVAGDYFRVRARQDSTGDLDLIGGAPAVAGTSLACWRIGD